MQADLKLAALSGNVSSEIRQVEALTNAEKDQLFGWGDDIFGADNLNLRWRPKQLHFLIYADGEPVSHVGILKHEVIVAAQPVMVGGVGGVVTVPAFQKRGLARELMLHAANFFASWEVAAGLLFCLQKRVPYYQSMGWQLIDGPVVIEQPSGELISPLQVMVLPIGKQQWPQGEVRLNSFPW
ncbi:MAG TPA: GNAT family N-acetyltransferase [Pyrinomonadaceae bacterium]|nr:GNAT family N-acetyltransferase [Pyrinomonadaceae bacterium]